MRFDAENQPGSETETLEQAGRPDDPLRHEPAAITALDATLLETAERSVVGGQNLSTDHVVQTKTIHHAPGIFVTRVRTRFSTSPAAVSLIVRVMVT